MHGKVDIYLLKLRLQMGQSQLILRHGDWETRGITWARRSVTAPVRKGLETETRSSLVQIIRQVHGGKAGPRQVQGQARTSAYGSIPDQWSPRWGRAVAKLEIRILQHC